MKNRFFSIALTTAIGILGTGAAGAGVFFSGDIVTNGSTIDVGNTIGGASGTIDGGSRLTNNIDEGVRATSSGNTLLIQGAGSTLVGGVNLGTPSIGPFSSNNHLTISSGGGVTGGVDVRAGYANSLIVTDPGSYITGFYFDPGSFGAQVSILNGANITGGGILALSTNGSITVSGTGTILSSDGYEFDDYGSQMSVSNGALVLGFLSFDVNSFSNAVTVNGVGTQWTNASGGWGLEGTQNSLIVSGGATVTSLGGFTCSQSFNTLVVSDPGSSLLTPSYVGNNGVIIGSMSGIADLIMVTNGGLIAVNGDVTVGYGGCCSSPAVSNQLVITGVGSVVNCSTNTLYVGSGEGSGNLLSVLKGGQVITRDLNIGGPGTCIFSSGTITAASTSVANGLPFVIGNGTDVANYDAEGGTHSFDSGLVISDYSILSGCGTVNGAVTNYGTINLNNGCDMYFNGQVVNYGKIISAPNATPYFTGGLIDHTPPRSFPVLTSDGGFGISAGLFGFTIAWNIGQAVILQTSSNLLSWTAVQTNTMSTPYLKLSVPATTTPVNVFYRVKASQ